jgi:hypothetical protein
MRLFFPTAIALMLCLSAMGAYSQGNFFYQPKQGDAYCVGDAIPLKWHAQKGKTVSIEVSPDKGTSWTPIAHNVRDSFYVWQTQPDEVPSDAYFVHLTDSLDTPYLLSGGFSVGLPATITKQPSNINVQFSETARFIAFVSGIPRPTLQWYKYDEVNNKWLKMEGQTQDTLVIKNTTAADNNTYYKFITKNPCATITSDSARLGVTNKLHITLPNGGEEWEAVCETDTIRWEPANIPGVFFDVYFSESGGGTWHPLVKNMLSSPYIWTVPIDFPYTRKMLISVQPKNNEAWHADTSDALFAINPPPTKPRIYLQPHDTTVKTGFDASFSAASCAGDTPGTIWERSTNNGATWVSLQTQAETLYFPAVVKKDSGGLYRARFMNGNGYTLSNEARLIVTGEDQTGGVKEENALSNLSVIPIPAQDEITISFSSKYSSEITLCDILGKGVRSEKVIEGGEHTVRENVSALASGIYIVRISSGGTVRSVRFIKN